MNSGSEPLQSDEPSAGPMEKKKTQSFSQQLEVQGSGNTWIQSRGLPGKFLELNMVAGTEDQSGSEFSWMG